MKIIKLKYIGCGILFTVFFSAGCKKNLEQFPNDIIAAETFFKTPNDALLALNGCYGYLNGSQNDIYLDAMTDDAYAQYPWESNATAVGAGNVTVNLDMGYGDRYNGIRRFNFFLSKIESVPMDATLKKRYIAEVRALRAFSYFNLSTIFGPVPLITNDIVDPLEAKVAPTPQTTVFDFVLAELKAAAPDLPTAYSNGGGNEYGRMTKGAALALRARAALFYKKYDEAASDSRAVMDLGYKLFTKEPSAADLSEDYSQLVDFQDNADKAKFYKGLVSYNQQFWSVNERNSEVILSSQYAENINPTKVTTFLFPGTFNGWSSVTPTQDLVNSYGNRNGDPVTTLPTTAQRAANYNGGNYNVQFLAEFKNRDTRLYASILFPGNKIFINGAAATFVWGKGGNNNSKTGYNFRKLADPNYIQEQNGNNDYQLIRYAEVLLTFAEAQNELTGPNPAIYAAIDQVRNRAGMPNVDQAKYGNKDNLRTLILNERHIELAAEGRRFLDIRRLKIASTVVKDIRDITNDLSQVRKWEDKFYLFPYPLTATDRNPNLQKDQQAKGY